MGLAISAECRNIDYSHSFGTLRKGSVQTIPSSRVTSGEVGILPERRAVFPFIRRMEMRTISLLHVSASSSPEWRASAEASFFSSLIALSSQPPKDSKTRGMKAIPSAWQAAAADVIFVLYLTLRAWPAVTAAPCTVASWRGLMTVASRAASRPAAQPPM